MSSDQLYQSEFSNDQLSGNLKNMSKINDPGRRFYILAMICAFIFMQLPGLILSIISWRKSKNAGFSTTKATNAIIVNSVLMAFGIYFLFALSHIGSMLG